MKVVTRSIAIFTLAFAISATLRAVAPVNTSFFGHLAVKGYDVVAYFTDGKPVEGSKSITAEQEGAVYRFASEEHRRLFLADPDKYLPAYGGYCAWAVSQNSTAGIDPTAWKIVDGRLYLNYNDEVQQKWLADIPGFIAAADRNWPGLRDK
jgi:YHS domain-containing protein